MKPKHRESESEKGSKAWQPEDLDLAYRIHTLAQLLARQLVAPGPWGASTPAGMGWPAPATWPMPSPSVDLSMGGIPMAWPCCP